MLGVIPTNDPATYATFNKWLGSRAYFASLYFNQNSVGELTDSVQYLLNQADGFQEQKAQIYWNIPTPGAGQLEAIVAGTHDGLYRSIATGILAKMIPVGKSIYTRLPWEFNGDWQTNSARDKNGNWDGPLFAAAWQRIASILRQTSPLFRINWSPNVNPHSIDPELCYPGDAFVDYIAPDCYMRVGDSPGLMQSWYLTGPRGLQWTSDFATAHGKRFGLAEYGFASDSQASDAKVLFAWLKSLGAHLDHHNWWDRTEVINCQISTGALPQIAAAYKAAFA